MKEKNIYEAVVIGGSAGGMEAVQRVLANLPADFPIPIFIVLHIHRHSYDGFLIKSLGRHCQLPVKEADEKEAPEAGHVFLAPANYHLLIERDKTFSLSVEGKINYSRPAIDVLFESAAEAYGDKLIGVVLTGGNSDGAAGLKKIKDFGGLAIVQDPKTAEAAYMPGAAIKATKPDHVLKLAEISKILVQSVC
jgi:two-component system chemotaxis response regulator CheB